MKCSRDINADPPRVVSCLLRPLPQRVSVADMDIVVDAATRTRVLDGIATGLDALYVYPEVAKKMMSAIAAHRAKGDYDTITDGEGFAAMLTTHLRAVSHDRHLDVEYSPRAFAMDAFKDDSPPDAEMIAQMRRDNCGFAKVELLESNIGYVKFNFFGPPSECGATASAAMNFLAHVDAVIFDLRDNHGGDPDMVGYVASYLFDARTHLIDLYDRGKDKTTQVWTRPDVPGKKLAHQPAFILTSKDTFSGGEDFAYSLQSLKRVTIVGETTGGGAHPTRMVRLDDHFALGVPFARAINPITKTNWEGTGVTPDVSVAPNDGLATAMRLAKEAVTKVR